MAHLADMLAAYPLVGRPVLDQSGVQGVHMIRVTWDSDDDFLSAVEEQLGLKFQSRRAPVEVMMVDGIEKPVAN